MFWIIEWKFHLWFMYMLINTYKCYIRNSIYVSDFVTTIPCNHPVHVIYCREITTSSINAEADVAHYKSTSDDLQRLIIFLIIISTITASLIFHFYSLIINKLNCLFQSYLVNQWHKIGVVSKISQTQLEQEQL